MDIMPRVSKFKLAPLQLGKETLGERIARLRKEKGYTQVELAQKIGINQSCCQRMNGEGYGRITRWSSGWLSRLM